MGNADTKSCISVALTLVDGMMSVLRQVARNLTQKASQD
jgi:hypothetical protein